MFKRSENGLNLKKNVFLIFARALAYVSTFRNYNAMLRLCVAFYAHFPLLKSFQKLVHAALYAYINAFMESFLISPYRLGVQVMYGL